MKLLWTDSTCKSPLYRSILLLTTNQLPAPRPVTHTIQLSLSWANTSKEIHKPPWPFAWYPPPRCQFEKNKINKFPTWLRPEFRKKIWEGRVPASSQSWPCAKKKELLGPALFCSHPTPGVTTAPGAFPGCSPSWSCFGEASQDGEGMLCSGFHAHKHHPSHPDLISQKCRFCLQRLVLIRGSYKGWFPRLRAATKKKKHSLIFWLQVKILDSSVHCSVPQFPFSSARPVTTPHPHITKTNNFRLPFILIHPLVQRSCMKLLKLSHAAVIVQHNNNIKYHMLH